MNSELWHACAGPLVSLPPVGSLVVYFPQGHSEQVCFFWSWIGVLHPPDIVQRWNLTSISTLCRWQHQCKRRQMEFQVILIFLPSWFACYTMLLYMYDIFHYLHIGWEFMISWIIFPFPYILLMSNDWIRVFPHTFFIFTKTWMDSQDHCTSL